MARSACMCSLGLKPSILARSASRPHSAQDAHARRAALPFLRSMGIVVVVAPEETPEEARALPWSEGASAWQRVFSNTSIPRVYVLRAKAVGPLPQIPVRLRHGAV